MAEYPLIVTETRDQVNPAPGKPHAAPDGALGFENPCSSQKSGAVTSAGIESKRLELLLTHS